jgi:hypothetical protein
MYAADPRHARLGTKSGCRELFEQEGVAHPLGVGNVTSLVELERAAARIRASKPAVRELVVKLDEGVSGDGNAIVDRRGLRFDHALDSGVVRCPGGRRRRLARTQDRRCRSAASRSEDATRR